MRDIVLIGGGVHCAAAIDVIEANPEWNIIGIVDQAEKLGQEILGYRIIAADNDMKQLALSYQYAMITVGQIASSALREKLFYQALAAGFTLPSITSPLAHVARNAVIGEGSLIMHFAAIGPNAVVGKNSIINTRALVEHDSRVGDHCHISTAAVLNGAVSVGNATFVGSASVCRQGISIGDRCIIGFGTRVNHSIENGVKFLGERKHHE
jgi:sugar O-acyltransferase (sialic acid O-acetyltransferase NeuD family)